MEEKPLQSVFFHFRFKFLAITAIFFLVWVILSASMEFDQFATSLQFQLLGPFFIASGFFYLVFRRVPFKCPNCQKTVSTKKTGIVLIVTRCRERSAIYRINVFIVNKCWPLLFVTIARKNSDFK